MALTFLLALLLQTQPEEKAWTGAGHKQTSSFAIAVREWTVNWEHAGEGLFSIRVYDEHDELVSLIGNIVGNGKDASSVRATPGRFYLKIAGDRWTVQVDDARR